MISSYIKLGSELDKIKELLIEHGYPADVLLSCINQKLAHVKCIILYITHLEMFHCTSENQAKVSYFIMGSSSTQNFCSGLLAA